jgi:hypothetical protein
VIGGRSTTSLRNAVCLVVLLATACSRPAAPQAVRAVKAPDATSRATVTLETPVPRPMPVRTAARPAATSRAARVLPRNVGSLAAFRGLGAWVDVNDHTNDPATIVPLVRDLAKRGVKTLYIESARFKSRTDIAYPRALGAALDEAKARGMYVVAWYPPYFTNVEFDLRRSLAAVNFRSPEGNRFDAFGPDIEQFGVKNHAERNRRTVEYSRRLRAASDIPLAAIVYPPTQLQRRPGLWPDYPWEAFGRYYDIVMPMAYWTFRTGDAKGAADYTTRNAVLSRQWTGRPTHVIGGLAEDANPAEIAAYVSAIVESGSIGGSIYDVRTTTAAQWLELAALNR